jgi:putative aminopeptidase FrvX
MNSKIIETKFLTILDELLTIPSPPGREEKTAEFIRKQLDFLGYKHETDAAGNVLVRIVAKNSAGALTIMAAHMDEIAMVVTVITPEGDLKVINSGGLIPCKLGERMVEIVTDCDTNITGLFSMGSAHTAKARNGQWAPSWSDVCIKTGMTPTELKAAGVRVGSSAVPTKDGRGSYCFGSKNNPLCAAWTFDDSAGVAELLVVLEKLKTANISPENPLIIAFTVHEEGGCHGAKSLAFKEKPEVFIAIDGCPVLEPDGLKLDACPGTWSKDSLCNYDQGLIKDFISAAEQAGTELQVAVYDCAASDASAVYNAGLAPRTGFIGHVRTNSHGFEVAKLAVFSNTIKTIVEYIKKFV